MAAMRRVGVRDRCEGMFRQEHSVQNENVLYAYLASAWNSLKGKSKSMHKSWSIALWRRSLIRHAHDKQKAPATARQGQGR